MTPLPGFRSGLYRKYAGVFLVLVGGVLLLSGLVEMFASYQEERRELAEVQRERAASAAMTIEQFIDGIVLQMEGATNNPQPATPAGLERRRLYFLGLLRHVPAISDISYLDAQGRRRLRLSRILVDMVSSEESESYKEAVAGVTMTGEPTFSPVYFRNQSEPFITIVVPEQGPGAGAVVSEVNLKFIWDVVSQIAVGKTGYAYVVDARGILVAHPDISLVLKRTDLSSSIQVQTALKSSSNPANPGLADVIIARNLEANRVLTTYHPIGLLGWQVIVEQPLKEAFAPLYGSFWRAGFLLLIGLGLAVMAALYLARRMVTPIQALQAGAARIGSGELDLTIDVKTGDELETLADEFNQMTSRLRESYTGLEQKVQERTQALARAVASIEEKSRQLEVVSRHKSEFMTNMSHELRTPLNAIIGYTEMLQEQAEDLNQEDMLPDLQKIRDAGAHLLELVNDVLDLSRIEAGRMELYLETLDIAALVDGVVAVLDPMVKANGNTLVIRCPEDIGSMRADATKVRQLLFNLLSNACKFTERGNISLQVVREPVEGKDGISFSVTDTGIGMTPDQVGKLFQLFSQADSSIAARYGGTGLGLTVSRQFCEMMGGDISVISEAGKGSIFKVWLPAVVEPLENLQQTGDGSPALLPARMSEHPAGKSQ